MGKKEKDEHLRSMAIVLAGSIRKIFEKRGIKLTPKPILEKKPIVEFMRRMRVFGMEKFSEATFISSVNYYLSKKDMEKRNTLGALVIYVEQYYIDRFLKILQYPQIDDDDEDAVRDACGAICNLIAGQFKADLSLMGYAELEMSHFSSYRNSAMMGIAYYTKIPEKYELSFFIKGEKRLVAEISMGPIPRLRKDAVPGATIMVLPPDSGLRGTT